MTPEAVFFDLVIPDAQQQWKQGMFTQILLCLPPHSNSNSLPSLCISLQVTHQYLSWWFLPWEVEQDPHVYSCHFIKTVPIKLSSNLSRFISSNQVHVGLFIFLFSEG